MANSPSLQILVREPEGFSVWEGPPFNDDKPRIKLERSPCSSAKFSEDGSRFMVIKSNSISIYNATTSTELKSFDIPSVLAATISPCGTYLQALQNSHTPQDKNVTLWHIDTATSVYQQLNYKQFQKNLKNTWPLIHFSSDESVACRMATNEIQFFDGKDFAKGVTHRLRVPGLSKMELAKAPGSHIAVFIAEQAKGAPASVQIFSCDKEALAQPVARRSFFRCSNVQFHWNRGSTALLAVAESDVDKTNQSYYGESKLGFLPTDASDAALVNLSKEGPVHDVQWSPSGLEFAVVYGFMPAKVTVFDKKCKPLFELGTGPYNTIRWNPKGRFLCVAGYGNLPGHMAFWDIPEKKLLGATKAEWSVTSEWSPDGRYFMTATTAPRLQVDNGLKVFHHNGSSYFTKMFEKLYQVDWKPEASDKFGDIAELADSVSTLKLDGTKKQAQNPKPSLTSAKTPANTIQKPAAYRPPGAKSVNAAQAELFGGSPSSQEASKNASRNKKRREKQREKKAAEASGTADGS